MLFLDVLLRRDDNCDKTSMPFSKYFIEEVYFAHYTAFQIEDQIREIRVEDYPLREKYNELFGAKDTESNENI